jgi:hypothetical protein
MGCFVCAINGLSRLIPLFLILGSWVRIPPGAPLLPTITNAVGDRPGNHVGGGPPMLHT